MDLDWLVGYRCGAGTIEEVKTGNLRDFSEFGDVNLISEIFKAERTRGEILIPSFVGVYQERKVVSVYKDQEAVLKGFRKGVKVANSNTDRLLLDNGWKDSCHRDLIQVFYDSDTSDREIVLNLLGNEMGRVKISPIKSNISVYDKNTFILHLGIFDKERVLRGGRRYSELNPSEIRDAGREFNRLLDRFLSDSGHIGLTRNEEVLIRFIKHCYIENGH
jgi:hypothetical protein